MWIPIVFISTPDEINMGVENQAVCIDRLLVGPLGAQAIFKMIRGHIGPYSPTPLLLRLCYMCLYALKSVLKGSPFFVHRTDRPTTAP